MTEQAPWVAHQPDDQREDPQHRGAETQADAGDA